MTAQQHKLVKLNKNIMDFLFYVQKITNNLQKQQALRYPGRKRLFNLFPEYPKVSWAGRTLQIRN